MSEQERDNLGEVFGNRIADRYVSLSPSLAIHTDVKTDGQFINPDKVFERYSTLSDNTAVTHDYHELEQECEVRDVDWNHMDHAHRPHIHNSYQTSLRLFRSSDVALSFTKISGLPLFTFVTDIRLAPGLFFQTISLPFISIQNVLQICSIGDGKILQRADWYIISHRLFRLLHKPLNGTLQKFNERVNREDRTIRGTRTALRKKGYSFRGTDLPDYNNSNEMSNNVVYPDLAEELVLPLDFSTSDTVEISFEPFNVIVKEAGDDNIFVWLSVCPHEGGPLDASKICNNIIECPWHGLKIKGRRLSPSSPRGRFNNLDLLLDADQLVITSQN